MPPSKEKDDGRQQHLPISLISVAGFKSIADKQSIEIRPLTLLAGANSSGKSSMMQAVLLLKQTLEASYDPGPLLLSGPNVRFTSVDQMLSRGVGGRKADEIVVHIGLHSGLGVELAFGPAPEKRLDVRRCTFEYSNKTSIALTPDMPGEQILDFIRRGAGPLDTPGLPEGFSIHASVIRDRCFLQPVLEISSRDLSPGSFYFPGPGWFSRVLRDMIHLPGLRGNPERAYPLAATGPEFPGTFEKYTASVVAEWSRESPERLDQLGRDLAALGLTWKVEAKKLDDTRVELRVGRLRKPQRGAARDLVNIADVGFGVSQTLPVLVALLTAEPGQLLYIEQPEIHLHPRAQVAMASLLTRAAARGVRLVIETHSSLLLLGVQSAVAAGELDAGLVKLHWFTRGEKDGVTTIASADLDAEGRFGDWPQDFDEVALRAQAHYLDLAESRLARK